MSDIRRRDFIAGAASLAAAAAASIGAAREAAAGDASFMNNVPDPLLTGEELPTFKLHRDSHNFSCALRPSAL